MPIDISCASAHHPAEQEGDEGVEAEKGNQQRSSGGHHEEEGGRVGVGPADDGAQPFERARDLVQRVLDLERNALHVLHSRLQPLHQRPLQLIVLRAP